MARFATFSADPRLSGRRHLHGVAPSSTWGGSASPDGGHRYLRGSQESRAGGFDAPRPLSLARASGRDDGGRGARCATEPAAAPGVVAKHAALQPSQHARRLAGDPGSGLLYCGFGATGQGCGAPLLVGRSGGDRDCVFADGVGRGGGRRLCALRSEFSTTGRTAAWMGACGAGGSWFPRRGSNGRTRPNLSLGGTLICASQKPSSGAPSPL